MENEEKLGQEPSSLFSVISNLVYPVVYVFENFGWYILIAAVILSYVYQNYLKAVLGKYRQQKAEAEYAAKYHKNPDLLSARLTAQEKRTLELQEKYKRDAEEYTRKMEEKAEKKRQELLGKTDGGQRLGSSDNSNNSSSSSLKPDYNPLMGGGSSSNYRAPKRSACSRGGCG